MPTDGMMERIDESSILHYHLVLKAEAIEQNSWEQIQKGLGLLGCATRLNAFHEVDGAMESTSDMDIDPLTLLSSDAGQYNA